MICPRGGVILTSHCYLLSCAPLFFLTSLANFLPRLPIVCAMVVCMHCGKLCDGQKGLSSHLRHCGGVVSFSDAPVSVPASHTQSFPASAPTAASDPTDDFLEALVFETLEGVGQPNNVDLQDPRERATAVHADGDNEIAHAGNEEVESEDGDDAEHVIEPSTVAIDAGVEDCMFKPPSDFQSDWFQKHVKSGEGVRFVDGLGDRLEGRSKSILELLKILKGKDLKLFDDVMAWKYECEVQRNDVFNCRDDIPKRDHVLELLQRQCGYDALLPEVRAIKLPNTGCETKIVVFPFREMFLSLLTDPVAMQPGNLKVDPNDPFKAPMAGGPDGQYGDLESGSVSVKAHSEYCTGEKDILCEVILFIDKTHLDVKGKHTLEPIMFTLSIFNRSFRNHHQAWRCMGYIPNIDQMAPHASADDKQADYQLCLRVLLSELVVCQNLGGIDWTISFGEKDVECRLQIPVSCVMGDTEGHDKMMARKIDRQGRNENANLCRTCTVPFKELGIMDPDGTRRRTWRPVKCKTIRSCRNRPTHSNLERLSVLGYKPHHDGFVDVHFSDKDLALHGCTYAELLHALQLGMMDRAVETLTGAKKSKRKTAKEVIPTGSETTGEEPVDKDVFYDAEEGHVDNFGEDESDEELSDGGGEEEELIYSSIPENTSVKNVFSKKARARVDD